MVRIHPRPSKEGARVWSRDLSYKEDYGCSNRPPPIMGQETIYRCDRGGCEETTTDPSDWKEVERIDPEDIVARKRFYYCPDCENYAPPNEPFDLSVEEINAAIRAVSGNR